MGISLVQATGFSPSSLIYELKQGEEECKMITITSDSEQIMVSDNWAENKDIEWKVNLFETEASVHGISINYNDELSIDERQVEVCLSGSNVGEYHGVILLKQGQEGNSIVQMGVWLKVTITEEVIDNPPASTNTGGGSSGGGGGSYVTPENTTETTTPNQINEELVAESEEIDNEVGAGITGAVIGGTGKAKIIGIVFAVIIIAGLVIYNKELIKEKLMKKGDGDLSEYKINNNQE